MINRLINIEVTPPHKNMKAINHSGNYTLEEYVAYFINGMSTTQRQRFKQMLENKIESGMSVAKNLGLNYRDFINEVKRQLKVEV